MDLLLQTTKERLLGRKAFALLEEGDANGLHEILQQGVDVNTKRKIILPTDDEIARERTFERTETLGSFAIKTGQFFCWLVLRHYAHQQNKPLHDSDDAAHRPFQTTWNIICKDHPHFAQHLMDYKPSDHHALMVLRLLSQNEIQKEEPLQKNGITVSSGWQQEETIEPLIRLWNKQCDLLDERDELLAMMPVKEDGSTPAKM